MNFHTQSSILIYELIRIQVKLLKIPGKASDGPNGRVKTSINTPDLKFKLQLTHVSQDFQNDTEAHTKIIGYARKHGLRTKYAD